MPRLGSLAQPGGALSPVGRANADWKRALPLHQDEPISSYEKSGGQETCDLPITDHLLALEACSLVAGKMPALPAPVSAEVFYRL